MNAITCSHLKNLKREQQTKEKECKQKGKQIPKDEWVEQRLLATKISEEITKMRLEQLESLVARIIARIMHKETKEPRLTQEQGVLNETKPLEK